MNISHKKKFHHKALPIIKRALYVLLFVLIAAELINVYAQFFNSPKQQVVTTEPLTEEEPVQFSQNGTVKEEVIESNSEEEWGKSRQVDEHTWTIKVGQDKHMGTPEEILAALNTYRQRHGSPTLTWDQKLADYAQSRAEYFSMRKATDKHAGFTDFVNNQEGFDKLGFNGLGENSSYGFHVEGVHLIEWVYAGDEPHDKNQLNPEWTHVGIGTSGTATNLIFGGKKQ